MKNGKIQITKYGYLTRDGFKGVSLDPDNYLITYRNPYVIALCSLLFPFIATQLIKLIAILSMSIYSFMVWTFNMEKFKELIEFTGVNARICTVLGIMLLICFIISHVRRYKDTKLFDDKRQKGLSARV